MKKRILSMLLLVAMLATALPLLAFPVLAAEKDAEPMEYTAGDYNALYVQDGLVYAADWFSSNTHWGEIGAVANTTANDAAATAFNNGRWFAVNDKMKLTFSSGSPVDASVTGGAFVANVPASGNTNSTFDGSLAAAMDYSYQGSAMEIIRTFPDGTASTLFLNDTRIAVSTAGKLTDAYNISQYDGWLAMADGSPILSYSGKDAEGNTFRNPAIALDAPTAPHSYLFNVTRVSGEVFTDRHKYMDGSSTKYESVKIYETKTIYVTGEEGSYTVVDEGTEGAIPLTVIDTSKDPASGGTSNATYGRSNPCVLVTAGYTYDGTTLTAFDHSADTATQAANIYVAVDRYTAAEGSVSFYQDGNELINEENVAFLNNTYGDQTNMHHWNDGYGAIYALRYYSRELSPEESALNHVADLAKFYKLNIGYYQMLEADGRAAVAEAMATYHFGSDAEAVESAFATASRNAAVAQYEGDRSSAELDMLALFGIDVSDVIDLPASVMTNTFALIAGLVDGTPSYDDSLGATVEEAYQAALEMDAAAYTAEGTYALDDYNALYVLDGLVHAIDFYKTNEYWEGGSTTYESAIAASVYAGYTWYTAHTSNYVRNGTGTIANGGFAADISTAHNSYMNFYINSACLPAEQRDFTREIVAVYGDSNKSHEFFVRDLRLAMSGSTYNETDGATLGFGSISNSYSYFYQSGTSWQWETPWTTVHTFKNASGVNTPVMYHAGHRAVSFSFVYDLKGYLMSTTSEDGNSALLLYAAESETPVIDLRELTGGELLRDDKTAVTPAEDGSYKGLTQDAYNEEQHPAHYGFGCANPDPGANDNFGYNSSFNGTLYANRYYARALTQAETLQNHFADLAKFFRLNVSDMEALTEEQKATVYEAVRGFDLATSSRHEITLAYLGALCEVKYAGLADVLPAAYANTVVDHLLDPTPVLTLPKGALSETMTVLARLLETPDYDGAADDYEAAVAADLATFLGSDAAYTDYDSLYVQDGLYFAMDFFRLNNALWADAAPSIAFRDVDLSGITYADGDTLASNADLKNAVDVTWKNQVEAPWLAQFYTVQKPASNQKVMAGVSNWSTVTSVAQAQSIYQPGNGYIAFRKDLNYNNGLTFDNGALFLTDNVSQQIIAAPMESMGTFSLFYNVRPYLGADGYITGFSSDFFGSKELTSDVNRPIPLGERVIDLTLTLEGGATAGGTDHFKIRAGTETLIDATGTYSGSNGTMYLGYGNSTNMRLYAFRMYNAELTEAEIAQNHFADLAKFFRMDVSAMESLSATKKAEVYEAMLDLDLATSTRTDVFAAYAAALHSYKLAEYRAMADAHPEIDADVFEVAADYYLDLTALTSTRKMDSVYTALAGGFAAGTTIAEARELFDGYCYDAYYYHSYSVTGEADWNAWLYELAAKGLDAEALMALPFADRTEATALVGDALTQDALNAYVADKMAAYAAGETVYIADDYNALYVKDGLVYAADWFSSNEHWGEVGAVANITVPSEVSNAFNNGRWFATNDGMKITFGANYSVDADVIGGAFVANKVPADNTNSTFSTHLSQALNYSYSDSSMEVIRALSTADATVFFLNDTRVDVNSTGSANLLYTTSNKGTYTKADGTNVTVDGKIHRADGTPIELNYALDTYTDVHTYRLSVRRPSSEKNTSGHTWVYYDEEQKKNVSSTVAINIYEEKTVWVLDGTVVDAGTEGAEQLTVLDKSTVGTATVATSRLTPANQRLTGYMLDGTSVTSFDYTATPNSAEANIYVRYASHTEATGYIGFWQDSTEIVNENNVAYLNNVFGRDTNMHHWNNGYGAMYALRYYSCILSPEAAAQNHFADLAKFFRLDVTAYLGMSETDKEAVHTAMAPYAFDDDRDAVVAAYMTATAEYYAGLDLSGDAELDAAFAELANATQLDVKRLVALNEPEEFMQMLVDSFDPAYAVSKTVVTATLKNATEFVLLNLFDGTQVRIDNYANDLAGVRATFEINEELYAKLIEVYGSISFGTEILVDGNVKARLEFAPVANGEGGYDYVGTNTVFATSGTKVTDATTKYVTDENDVEHLTYTYAVTYKTPTAEVLERTFSYRRFITLGEGDDAVTYTVDVNCDVFGTEFSGANVYRHFANNWETIDGGKYDYSTDSVVEKIIGILDAQ